MRDEDELLRTPEDAKRKCTDVVCLVVFLAIMGGLGYCIHQSVEAGDIQRLQSLPDYQGTQCMEKLVFFPLADTGLDLHRQVCVDECPVSNTATVVTYLHERRLGSLEDAIGAGVAETDGLLQPAGLTATDEADEAPKIPKVKEVTTKAPAMEVKAPAAPVVEAPVPPPAPVPAPPLAPMVEAPVAQVEEGPSISINPLNGGLEMQNTKEAPANTEEVVVQGYPSFPLAGVLCIPNVREFEGNITALTGKNVALQAVLHVTELWHNHELLLMAAIVTVLLSLIFLCFVENCAKTLVMLSITALIVVPALFGGYLIYKEHRGEVILEEEEEVMGIMSPEYAWWAAIGGFILSAVMMICACCLCDRCENAAHAVEEAAQCLMTMPSLLLEPIFSFVIKIPVFVVGALVFIMLIGSGDYNGSVDLTNPQSLFHPDSFSSVSAIYFLLGWLLIMELLHYISVFVVIYVAEVWFFKHFQQTERSSFCAMCGLLLLAKGFLAAMQHLGSLIFASLLMALFRPIRWVVNAFLMAEEAASMTEVAQCIIAGARWIVDTCLMFIQKVLGFTSQVAFMQMALDGTEGYCASLNYVMTSVFRDAKKWTAVEGLGASFVVLGVGGISTGTGFLIWLVTRSFDRYSKPDSAQFVSDPESTALAAALVGGLMSLCFLHHFQTITDTIAYCRGLQRHVAKYAEDPEDERCCECWGKDSRETEKLLKR